MAAVDFFLKIDGVDGESTDDKHKGEIEISSFSWGVSQIATRGGGGGLGAGKASFQDLNITTHFGKHSPLLERACASGEHFKKAVLTARKSGGDRQQDFYVVTFEDCLISSYQSGGTQGEVPMDQISLNFAKVMIRESPTTPR